MEKLGTENCYWWHHRWWWCHQRHHARMFPNYASWWLNIRWREHKTPPKSITITVELRSEADVANSPARRPGKVAPIYLAVSVPDRGWLPPRVRLEKPPPSTVAHPLPVFVLFRLTCHDFLMALVWGFPSIVFTVGPSRLLCSVCYSWLMYLGIFKSDVLNLSYSK